MKMLWRALETVTITKKPTTKTTIIKKKKDDLWDDSYQLNAKCNDIISLVESIRQNAEYQIQNDSSAEIKALIEKLEVQRRNIERIFLT